VALVNASIGQLDRFTQQNAALVEQMAASAGSLHQQTVALSGLVARFKVPDSSARVEGVAAQLS
jgi:methyl-accepting chemotaxis protein